MTEGSRSSSELDHPRVFAAFVLASAVLTVALLVGLAQPTPPDPASQLVYVAAHRPLLALQAVLMLSSV